MQMCFPFAIANTFAVNEHRGFGWRASEWVCVRVRETEGQFNAAYIIHIARRAKAYQYHSSFN